MHIHNKFTETLYALVPVTNRQNFIFCVVIQNVRETSNAKLCVVIHCSVVRNSHDNVTCSLTLVSLKDEKQWTEEFYCRKLFGGQERDKINTKIGSFGLGCRNQMFESLGHYGI